MHLSSIVLCVILLCAISGLNMVDCNRWDVLKAFLPLKTVGVKQQRKLLAGGSELFVSLQSELILSQEPYIQQTIDDEANLLRNRPASSWISDGNVAENMSVWRSSLAAIVSCSITFSIDGRKPMSSMRSASSSTTNFTFSNVTAPRPIKSIRRPGVATRIWQPVFMDCIWEYTAVPP
uniref:Uncharacterized protein n=1 Tax=Anopheles atroparvus TaxID=41427 RepID=A0A182JB35_ANOAO